MSMQMSNDKTILEQVGYINQMSANLLMSIINGDVQSKKKFENYVEQKVEREMADFNKKSKKVHPEPSRKDQEDDYIVFIESFTNDDVQYKVNLTQLTCTCPHHVYRDVICKHIEKARVDIL